MSSKEQDVLTLDIDKINALSPYAVTYDEDERAFVFVTANGQNCYVSFSPDEGALPEINRVYYLLVGTHPNQCFREDPAIRDAITAIVTVFLKIAIEYWLTFAISKISSRIGIPLHIRCRHYGTGCSISGIYGQTGMVCMKN